MRPGSEEHYAFLELVQSGTEPILTNVDIRRRIGEAIALELPQVAVLCYQELLPETTVGPSAALAASELQRVAVTCEPAGAP